ncbi:MAG: HDIG domain-containing protein [Epulopiscium sp.]|nr:HDIG domain-containing protein [Candidatus Epulonipiscium sp.]
MKKGEKKVANIRENLNKYGFLWLLIITAFLFTFLIAITGQHIQDNHKIEVGAISTKQILAPREVENTIATERKKEQIKKNIEPLFKKDSQVDERVLSDIKRFFEALQQTQVLEGEEQSFAFIKKRSPIFLTEEQFRLALGLSYIQRGTLEKTCIEIAENILDAGIKEEAITKNILDVKDEFAQSDLSLELQMLGYHVVSSVLRPNIIKDEQATYEEMMKRLSTVEPVKILPGQKIIGEGEVITEEIYEILKSLHFIKQEQQNQYIPIIGIALLILLTQGSYIYYVFYFHPYVFEDKKESLLLFFIYISVILVIRLMSNLPFYLIPISIAAMLISILMNTQLGIATNVMITIVGTMIYKGNINFFVFFLIGGLVSALLVKETMRRNKVLRVGCLIILMNTFIILGLDMLLLKGYSQEFLYHMLYGVLNGGISIIVTIGSLPFWEAAFDVITPIKLLDLTNPDQPLLRRLSLETPGTYHHSLLVANLAEAAALNVGANSLLTKVGAYYHDIGKLKYPSYFKENQMGENPHDLLEPDLSAQIILQHVSNGVQLSKTYKLPKVIKDIIQQHQGTTVVKYFYYQAMKRNPDVPIVEDQYRYKGPIPQTKEAAIVMLADTVEAAVRAQPLEKQNEADISKLIQTLIQEKLEDGQLKDSNLKIKDLEIIKDSFMTVFNGMYHQRIEYPKIKEEKEENTHDDLDRE